MRPSTRGEVLELRSPLSGVRGARYHIIKKGRRLSTYKRERCVLSLTFVFSFVFYVN
jgi:hypothetical protein